MEAVIEKSKVKYDLLNLPIGGELFIGYIVGTAFSPEKGLFEITTRYNDEFTTYPLTCQTLFWELVRYMAENVHPNIEISERYYGKAWVIRHSKDTWTVIEP